MNSSIDVISFLRKFKQEQKESVRDQVPLLLFPRLIELGFSFLTSASILQHESSSRKELLRMIDFQEPVVQDFLILTTTNGIKLHREAFNYCLDEMNLFYNGMTKNFMVDFSNSFGSGYHISSCFDGSIESLDEDERLALFIYFQKLGLSIIFQSFLFLGENYPSNEDFQGKLRQYTRVLASRMANCSEVA
jgi:hypothetical protein